MRLTLLMKAPCRGAIMVEICDKDEFHRPVGAEHYFRFLLSKKELITPHRFVEWRMKY